MNTLQFSKMQSAGNDFIVFWAQQLPKNAADLAVKLCDRHFGIGADGLLWALPSAKANIRMAVFNADGSEAQTCGNGIRALAKFVVENGHVTPVNNMLTIETKAGISNIDLIYSKDQITSMEVSMGQPFLNPSTVPVETVKGLGEIVNLLTAKYPVCVDELQMGMAFVGMGNPHAVYFQDKAVAHFPLERIGPKVEKLSIFPQRTNFEVARILTPNEIEVRIWERGVGETLACGSGACAVAVAAMLLGLTKHKVTVKVPGGDLTVSWDGAGDVYLCGPSEFVYSGTINI